MKRQKKVVTWILVGMLVLGMGGVVSADKAVGSTMELSKTEGEVSVENMNGRGVPTIDNMKLYSGYQLTTEKASYAWITLDDSRVVKEDAVSEVEVRKRGKDLELLVSSGSIFFDVAKPLETGENLSIRTSTMTMGIRGTCGVVKVDHKNQTTVTLIEGQVQCYVQDPITGQQKSIVLNAGQKAIFVTYEPNKIGDKCDIIIEKATEQDIPGFVAVEIAQNAQIRNRVQSGMPEAKLDQLVQNAERLLTADEERLNEKLTAINEVVRELDRTSVQYKEWGGEYGRQNGSDRFPGTIVEDETGDGESEGDETGEVSGGIEGIKGSQENPLKDGEGITLGELREYYVKARDDGATIIYFDNADELFDMSITEGDASFYTSNDGKRFGISFPSKGEFTIYVPTDDDNVDIKFHVE